MSKPKAKPKEEIVEEVKPVVEAPPPPECYTFIITPDTVKELW